MKAKFRIPKTNKGWFGLVVISTIVILGIWPVISFFNQELIFLGLPLIMVWSVGLIVITSGTLMVLNKMGVND